MSESGRRIWGNSVFGGSSRASETKAIDDAHVGLVKWEHQRT